ncbi:DNA alkylation repair protein, partial [Balneolaceae bacterium ANBcel3]|nr:DNA alkylation repair protein [Balneolaceae bacterium ANBcel3]
MFGAIAGDIAGSVLEGTFPGDKNSIHLFPQHGRVTDDSVLTLAVAEAARLNLDFSPTLHEWGNHYPEAGYGIRFIRWLRQEDPAPYNSFGNGSAMRVSPTGWIFDDIHSVQKEAEKSALATHDHPEGVRGAVSMASAIFLARKGASKDDIRSLFEHTFSYSCKTVSYWKGLQAFDVTCQGTVPAAVAAFLESESLEDTIRTAISIGGDTDTLAAIAGSLAEAFYQGISPDLLKKIWPYMDWRQQGEAAAFLFAYYPEPENRISLLDYTSASAHAVRFDLMAHSNPAEAVHKQRFFKTAPGQYGEGDRFLGIKVPQQRSIAKKYADISPEETDRLITSRFHEERLTALLLLTYRFKRADAAEQKRIFDDYLRNKAYINNWDLVDVTAPIITGPFLESEARPLLLGLVSSDHLWDRRIAMLSTLYQIRKNDFKDTLMIADALLADPEDLMHKAVGWMLREVWKRSP